MITIVFLSLIALACLVLVIRSFKQQSTPPTPTPPGVPAPPAIPPASRTQVPWKIVGIVAGGIVVVGIVAALVAGTIAIPIPNVAGWRSSLSFLLIILAIAWWGVAKGYRWLSVITVIIALVAGGPLWFAHLQSAGWFTSSASASTQARSGMPSPEFTKDFEVPQDGSWSPFHLVVLPRHHYSYEILGGYIEIWRYSDKKPFPDGPGVKQPFEDVRSEEQGTWKFRALTTKKTIVRFHYSRL